MSGSNGFFDNRELAILIWLALLFILMLANREFRKSILNFLKVFCVPQILTSFLLMSMYVAGEVFLLESVGAWNESQIKNTAKWYILVAAIEIFKAGNIKDKENYFLGVIARNFTLLAILEFIVAIQPFSFWIELLLVPITVFMVMASAMAETKPELNSVKGLFAALLSAIGFSMLMYGVFYVCNNFDSIDKELKVMDFLTPILLSILYLPFVFLFSLYVLYDGILVRINIYTDDSSIRRYARYISVLHFKHDYKALDKWLAFSCMSEFESKETIEKSISEFAKQKIS